MDRLSRPVSWPVARTSSVLAAAGFAHAFFTRQGGVSEGAYATLNTSAGAGDDAARVRENIARIERSLEIAPGRLFYGSQVHGTGVIVVSDGLDRDDALRHEADIVVSDVGGTACGVRSADCGTILVADRRSGAVAAIHSGWRGTVLGAAGAGVRALRTMAPNADLVAAIGPHIEPCCFEVGDDVAAELAGCSSVGDRAVDRSREKPYVDLRSIMTAQLVAEGIDASRIDHVRGCTVCDELSFFSFRRDGKKSGRLMSAIVARAR